jgi:hypothetical protein
MTDWRATPQKPVEETAVPSPSTGQSPAPEGGTGMTVEEEVLRVVSAQLLYQLHCECGRSWFALELPTFVKCPACRKVGMVSL